MLEMTTKADKGRLQELAAEARRCRRQVPFLFLLFIFLGGYPLSVSGGYTREGLEVLHAMLRLHFAAPDGSLEPITMLEFGDQVLTTYIPREEIYAPFSYYNFVMPFQRDFGQLYAMKTFASTKERQQAEREEKLKQFPAKKYFQHLGFDHFSIDYNGDNGALSLDVRGDLTLEKPLQNKRFDVITNIGFSEHVGEDLLSTKADKSAGHDDEEEYKSLYWLSQYLFFENLHKLGTSGTLYHHHVPSHDADKWLRHGICGYSPEFFASLISRNNYSAVLGPLLHSPTFETITMYRKQSDEGPFMTFEDFQELPLFFKYQQHYSFVFEFHTEEGESTSYGIDDTSSAGVLQSAEFVCRRHLPASISSTEQWIATCVDNTYHSLLELIAREEAN